MTRIYLIRHAEAEGNLYRRIHGHYESLITSNGFRQIAALERRFADEKIDACYASDLLRTCITARAIYVPKNLPLQRDKRFREIRLGSWEDVPFGRLEYEQPEAMVQFNADPFHWGVEGSETYEACSDRFLEAMQEAVQAYAGGTIAIFAHGAVIRAVQQRLFYAPEEIGQIGHSDNTGVSLLEFENGEYRKIYLNDNSHLSEEISTLARQKWWRDGGRDNNLWFRPVTDGGARYTAFRRDAWQKLYGAADSFDAGAYYDEAAEAASEEPLSLAYAMLGGRVAGMIQLSPRRGEAEGIGGISFLYLLPEYRGERMGIQMVGQAASFFRARGRTRLRLCVSPRNQQALGLYRAAGFQAAGWTPGKFDDLILMEKEISLERWRREYPKL